MHHSADLEKSFLVMHHVSTSEAGDGVIFAQKNRLLRANFLAHAAVDAANHVDIEFLGKFFDLGKAVGRRNLAWNNFDRARRTNEFAQLTRDATHTAVLISHKRWRAAVVLR